MNLHVFLFDRCFCADRKNARKPNGNIGTVLAIVVLDIKFIPGETMATKSKDSNETGTIEKISNAIGNMMPGGRTNATELLKADHDKVRELFEKVKSSEESRHPALFERIKTELDVHTHIEETIFYPALIAGGDEELVGIVREGIEEHRQVKMFLREIQALQDDSFKFEPKLKVLMEDVEHHADEEESDMFPKVRKQFESQELESLAARMEKEKREYKKTLSASAGKRN